MSTPEEAAYHEAGHCYVAVRDAGRIVELIEIYKENGEWGGNTHIINDHENYLYWTTIAVAGIVAEARADAERRFSGENVDVAINGNVVEQVKDYVDMAEDMAKGGAKAIQITFPTAGAKEGVSAMSVDDVRRMTVPYRDRLSLGTSLRSVAEICNNPNHWTLISDLAKALLRAEGNRLNRKDLEAIIKR